MKIDIKFICVTCAKINTEKGYRSWEPAHIDDEWSSLTEAWQHLRENDHHEVIATSEVEIHL